MADIQLNSVALATESSGTITLDSAITGIPAAGVTGTLASAVTDNITTLGTVTAGSIAGGAITSATTFPAGHMVSFDFGYYSHTDIGKNDTNFTEANTALRVTITPTSPNKILLVCQGGMMHCATDSSMYVYCSFGIVGGSMNLADSAQGLETSNRNTKTGHSMAIVVTPASYGSAITYTPTYRTTGGHSYFSEGGSDQNITSYAMEIKQ